MPKTMKRCPWLKLTNEMYVRYHDEEWGRPVHDDHKHFEMITLEGAQAGLSWETVLKKRENYRKLFCEFDPHKVARFNKRKIESLLKNEGIIRNRLKVESTVSNAKAFIAIQKEFGSFDKYIWSFVDSKPLFSRFKELSDYPSKTEVSDIISKDLKKRSFRFVGSTIIYAYMQAAGLTQDHARGCFLYGKKFMEDTMSDFPKLNSKAPQFTLKDQNNAKVALKDFVGKKNVVVYFYPKAMTPGCTVQACGIRDYKKEFAKAKTVVLAISPDSSERLSKFEEKEDLNFTLLADEEHKIADKYGVWGEKKMMGRTYMGIKRTTFIIGKDGKIKHIMDKVKTKTHHDDVLDYINENL